MRGETATGVTTMRIDPGLDTGDILLMREIEIADNDNTETLAERLSVLGAGLMVETLRRLERGDLQPQPQDHALATLAPMLKKEDGRIDWTLKAEEIWWRVRGLRPWPGAYTTFRGLNLHIWAAARSTAGEPCRLGPGTLVANEGRLLVACGQGTLLEVQELQREGRRRLPAREFLNGVHLAAGEKLE
jgi:methionyl-tRNA formyltransferase